MRAVLVDRARAAGGRSTGRRGIVLRAACVLVPVVAVTAVLSVRRTHTEEPARTAASPSMDREGAPATRSQLVRSTRAFTTGHVGVFKPGAPLDRHPAHLTVSKTVTDDLQQQAAMAVLVVLPLANVPPSCVKRATLHLDVAAATGVPAELGAYPGAATSLTADGTPRSGEDDAAFLLDIQPRGLATVQRAGPASVDITDLYRLWAAGSAFPSGRKVPAGTPLLLVLRPAAADPGTWALALKDAPDISYVSDAACR